MSAGEPSWGGVLNPDGARNAVGAWRVVVLDLTWSSRAFLNGLGKPSKMLNG